jgi:hypothetical protein
MHRIKPRSREAPATSTGGNPSESFGGPDRLDKKGPATYAGSEAIRKFLELSGDDKSPNRLEEAKSLLAKEARKLQLRYDKELKRLYDGNLQELIETVKGKRHDAANLGRSVEYSPVEVFMSDLLDLTDLIQELTRLNMHMAKLSQTKKSLDLHRSPRAETSDTEPANPSRLKTWLAYGALTLAANTALLAFDLTHYLSSGLTRLAESVGISFEPSVLTTLGICNGIVVVCALPSAVSDLRQWLHQRTGKEGG